MARTFHIQGHKIRSASQRRYLVVRVRTDRWAVMDERKVVYAGSTTEHAYYEVAKRADGFRAIFTTEAEAVQACGPEQVVKVWSVAGAEIVKRSDSLTTAKRQASALGGVVVDTVTGEEI